MNMFSQLGATASTLSKASTIMFRMGTDAHLYDDPDDVSIAPLLDSKYESEKCEALKRLLALIAQGLDVSEFFPQVVKNVASHSLEVKKLVYLYLLHYAEKRPNEALLSINSFQKDLGDPNPLIRAWALRTMSGIRLHTIAPIVLVAVGKSSRDPSSYVRKCAANALPKLHDLRLDAISSSIEQIIGVLLNDYSPGVVGAAAAAYSCICPTNYKLIEKSYKRLCEMLPDVEEWGQVYLIEILLRFAVARHGLVKDSIMFVLHEEKSENNSADKDGSVADLNSYSDFTSMVARSYVEGPDEYLSRSRFGNENPGGVGKDNFTSERGNDDVKLLLQSTSPLLWSHNSAVVLAAVGVHWIMSPVSNVNRIAKPLIFLLRSSESSKYVVLCNIQVFAKAMPSLFSPHYEDFFVTACDSSPVKCLKLEILSTIMNESSVSTIFRELQDYTRDPDRLFAINSVSAIGLCAQRFKKMIDACVKELLVLTRHGLTSSDFSLEDEAFLVQAIVSLKLISKEDPPRHEKVLIHLMRSLDSCKSPSARALIIWVIGEFNDVGEIIPKLVVIILQYLARSFSSEVSETKLQVLNCIVKVILSGAAEDMSTVKKVVSYVLELAESDMDVDIRDRAGFLKKILSNYLVDNSVYDQNQNADALHSFIKSLFRTNVSQLPLEQRDYRTFLPGTLSQIVLHAAPGYEPLPKPCTCRKEDGVLSELNEDSEETDDSVSPDVISTSSSASSSDINDLAADSVHDAENGDNLLIQISDSGNTSGLNSGDVQSISSSLGQLVLQRSLESWLGEHSSVAPEKSLVQDQGQKSSAVIFIKDIGDRIKPKVYNLLDPSTGNGLKVDYSFSSDTPTIAPQQVVVCIMFENCSNLKFSNLKIVEDQPTRSLPETNTCNLVPMDGIASLEPGEVVKSVVYVRFNHHLLPLKLSLLCDNKSFPVKLRPDIGYFVKPLTLNLNAFLEMESSLPGMYEYSRSCAFIGHLKEVDDDKNDSKDKFLVVCQSLALTILSSSNLFLVSVNIPIDAKLDDASGLCLRFSSQMLSNSMPCLVTVTAEGNCVEPLNVSVKVNCEETVFGLNFLNRLVNVLG